MPTISKIIDEALHLPRTERTYLAKKLIESLEEGESLTRDERLQLERRSQEIRSGAVQTLTLDELKESVSAGLA